MWCAGIKVLLFLRKPKRHTLVHVRRARNNSMSSSNTTPSASETGAGSHSTPRRKSLRKRNLLWKNTTAPPAPSPDVAAEASSSSKSKVTAEDYREVATLFIALKVKMSKRKIERRMGVPGYCNGNRIAHHIKKGRISQATMSAEVWTNLVNDAWGKWKDTFEPPLTESLSGLAKATEEDLKLPVNQRKRKAAEAAIADMITNPSLSVAEASKAAGVRFNVTTLHQSTVYRLKKKRGL